jgi:phosphoribosylglycinamide formyltransferase-1
MVRVAILASGNGSNAVSIIKHFSSNKDIRVSLVASNNSRAGVLEKANNLGIKTDVFSSDLLKNPLNLVNYFKDGRIDFIVLAGYLKLIPAELVQAYPKRIVNIHPALLPKFGGKGMYGKRIHEAVIASGETTSGLTIHYVNEMYDEGNVIMQLQTEIPPEFNASDLASRILLLEHKYYPLIIENVIRNEV